MFHDINAKIVLIKNVLDQGNSIFHIFALRALIKKNLVLLTFARS